MSCSRVGVRKESKLKLVNVRVRVRVSYVYHLAITELAILTLDNVS